MSVATEIERLQTAKADLKTAIEDKGVTVPSTTKLDGYADLVGQISGGQEEAPENDVNFYDYDGFRVASYTIAEAKALTALPTPPTHEGLTFQEWNWTLADIQSYDRQYADIGANYITSDGKTRLKIVAEQNDVMTTFRGNSGTLHIDWGDGSIGESYSFATYQVNKTFTHTYEKRGTYCIVLNFEPSSTSSGFCIANMKIATTSGWIGVAIYEILCGYYFASSTTIASYLNFTDIHKMICTISIPTNSLLPSLNFQSSTFKCIVIPRSSTFKTGYMNFSYMPNTKFVFPKTISKLNDSYNFYQSINDKVVLPECSDLTGISSGALTNWNVAVISLPMSVSFASAGNVINSTRLSYIDIVQGWSPNINLTLSNSTEWSADNMTKFFNKLGTTTDTITLTFGTTNLNKLTEEEKAIATNKGYTLA